MQYSIFFKNPHRILAIISLMVITSFSGCGSDPVKNEEKKLVTLPVLSTERNRIVDEDGNPVILHGVNRSGLEYDNPGGNQMSEEEFAYMIEEWKCNIIRIPFNQDWVTNDAGYLMKLDQIVDWITYRDTYVILDLQWQSVAANIPPIPDTAAIDMWAELATRYKDNPGVLYDIHNEAHDTTFPAWKNRATEIIGAIRAVHPQSLILVSGMTWASDLRDWAANPLDYDNIVYSLHIYPWFGGSNAWPARFGNYADKLPIFCGEFGGGDDNLQWGKEYILYLSSLNIGWTAWSWVDDPHLTEQDHLTPTNFGEMVKTYLERFNLTDSSTNEIIDLKISNLLSDRATIEWDTPWLADSKVLYGLTTSYTDSVTAAAQVTKHFIKLQNLTPATIYHFSVVSNDELGFSSVSADSEFTTLSQ